MRPLAVFALVGNVVKQASSVAGNNVGNVCPMMYNEAHKNKVLIKFSIKESSK